MPELPEVESFRNFLEKTSLRKKIKEAILDDPFRLWDVSSKKLLSTLKDNSFISTHRHGKFLFVSLEKGGHLLFHFGMTGYFDYFKKGEDISRYIGLLIIFQNSDKLAFIDRRKIGRLSIIEDYQKFITKRGYGPDALKISEKEFLELLQGRKLAIKTALMNQRIVAGIGNEFSDEILFQSRIHPESKVEKLNHNILKNIYKHTITILKKAVAADADRDKLKKYFFLDNRKAGLNCPSCGGKTAFKTVGGRSAYFCPRCQVLIK